MKRWCVLLVIPLFLITIFDKPEKTIVRGPIVLKQYYRGGWIGGHARWPWTITIDGRRFTLPDGGEDEFTGCYTGPNKNIPAVLIYEGIDWYLLRIVNGKPDLKKLAISTWDMWSWTGDGRLIVFKSKKINAYLDVLTGAMTELPEYPEDFLCFSPDMRTIVSVGSEKVEGMQYRNLYQTDRETGKTQKEVLKASDYPWLGDWTHFKRYESTPNVWIAAHFRWEKGPDGGYRLLLEKTTPK